MGGNTRCSSAGSTSQPPRASLNVAESFPALTARNSVVRFFPTAFAASPKVCGMGMQAPDAGTRRLSLQAMRSMCKGEPAR